jgi:hypothetical protein
VTTRPRELVLNVDLRLDGPRSSTRIVGGGGRISVLAGSIAALRDLMGVRRSVGGSLRLMNEAAFPATPPPVDVLLKGRRIASNDRSRRRLPFLGRWRVHLDALTAALVVA